MTSRCNYLVLQRCPCVGRRGRGGQGVVGGWMGVEWGREGGWASCVGAAGWGIEREGVGLVLSLASMPPARPGVCVCVCTVDMPPARPGVCACVCTVDMPPPRRDQTKKAKKTSQLLNSFYTAYVYPTIPRYMLNTIFFIKNPITWISMFFQDKKEVVQHSLL